MRVERLELAGEGLLRARVEELRRRLEAEGLLEPARKRTPPMLPRRIGLVTSPDGAARDDVLTTLWARFPEADVVLVSTPVQGEAAPGLVARAIRHLDARPEVDVIVVARGGGSLEDLMAFNSEVVCRAVAGADDPGRLGGGARARRDPVRPGGRHAGVDAHRGRRGGRPQPRGPGDPPGRRRGRDRPRPGARRRWRRAPPSAAASGSWCGPCGARARWARDRVERLAPRLSAALGARRGAGPRAARGALRGAAAGHATPAGRRRPGGWSGPRRCCALLSPERTVARGYAIVRDAARRRR